MQTTDNAVFRNYLSVQFALEISMLKDSGIADWYHRPFGS